MDIRKEEKLFVGTAEAEHVEMYLKAIWHIRERGDDVKISTIAKILNIRQPSVVQMLKKLNGKNLVEYNKAGVNLTDEGEKIGSSMLRNSRLLEVLMDSALKVEIDEEMERIVGFLKAGYPESIPNKDKKSPNEIRKYLP